MALPTPPTANSIVLEALARINEPTPTIEMQTRAEDMLIGVINRIAKIRTWKVLEQTSTLIPSAYQPRYSIPADFSKGIQVSFFSGGFTGTMQTASPTSITLEATETLTLAEALGTPICTISGDAPRQFSRIISYDINTKVAGIFPAWATTPTSGDYLIPSEELDLPYVFSSRIKMVDSVDKPQLVNIYNDEVYLTPVPDNRAAALMVRFQLKPYKVDLTDSRLTRIYWDWREILILGVMRDWIYGTDDDRYAGIMADFKDALDELQREEARRASLT